MGRRAKPAKAKVEAKRPPARKSSKNEGSRVRDLEKRLAEALEQQTATSEILRVISSAPTDVQPVFDTIVRSAGRLCDAFDAVMYRRDGDTLHLVAHEGPIPTPSTHALIRGSTNGRAVLDGRTVHVADIQAEVDEFPEGSEIARRMGNHTVLSMPLMRKDGLAIGTIMMRRTEARLFTERQVALLQTVANQAVIAIENVRLCTELQTSNRELTTALDTQTATSDILRVISQSRTDVQPVFDVIVENACRLCDGVFANAVRFDGALMYNMAQYGFSPEAREMLLRAFPTASLARSMSARAILNRAVVQSEDMSTDVETTISHQLSRLMGFRAQVSVPMLRDGGPVGAITVARRERGPFPERQVDLLKTFASQAVIAIENVRLFTELQEKNRALTHAHAQMSETLDRQTATADVLRIIAQSPTELQPVLDAIAKSAVRLCAASDAVIERLEDDRFYNAAHAGTQMKGLVGLPLPLSRRFPGGRAVLDRRRVIIDDIHLVAQHEYPDTLELLKLNTIHSVAEIPLLSEGKPLGTIAVLRAEVRPFTDAEVTLLETFADQAVIAIENVRLFKELEIRNRDLTEALDRQTATSEILRVISSSPTDTQPVFDAIAAAATRLCDAVNGLVMPFDGRRIHLAAHYNVDPERLDALRRIYPMPPNPVAGRGPGMR